MTGHIPISAETIHELDTGYFGRAIDLAIERAMADIEARPADIAGKTYKRTIKIELGFTPEVEITAERTVELKRIILEPTCHGLLPPTRGGLTDIRLVRHKPHFNRDCPGNFSQRTLEYDQPEVLER